MKYNSVYEELEKRGLIKQITDEKLKDHLMESRTIYCGFDPTGDSLHIGHLLPIIVLKHLERYNHNVLAVVGGATGLIGDPSGKKEERKLNELDTVKDYSQNIRSQLTGMLDEKQTKFVNNYDWFSKYSAIEFLRDFGKDFGINYMLNKESVSARLESGLSYTEFSYMIIQSIDFYHLNKDYDCTIQIGGSDQWGNITSGLELIRKKSDKEAFGITIPLVTKSDGTKFGKTEGNAIWLDSKKTTPYEFYQFLLNTEDTDVVKYLKYFTFLDLAEIDSLEQEVENMPQKREAQKVLAYELTKFVHGKSSAEDAIRISKALFSGNIEHISKEAIEENFKTFEMEGIKDNSNILDVLITSKLASSKREAREFIKNNAISINGQKKVDVDETINSQQAIGNKYFLIKRGKKKFALIKVEDE